MKPPFAFPPFNPTVPIITTPPPPKDEPPAPVESKPEDDIRKIGNKISDAADRVADEVEAFRELIEDRQEDIDDAVTTFREIGKALESTGRGTREEESDGTPSRLLGTDLPQGRTAAEEIESIVAEMLDSREDNYPPPLVITGPIVPGENVLASAKEANESKNVSINPVDDPQDKISEPSEESGQDLPPWLPWVVAAGAGVWGLTRKPK